MIKTLDALALIQKHERSLQTLPQFFSREDLDLFEDWCLRSQRGATSTRLLEHQAVDNDWTSHPKGALKNEMLAFFHRRIAPLIAPKDDFQLDFDFAFHGNKKPYGIHTDAGYDPDEVIYQQGIIPLEVEPCDADVYTVILQQKCYHSSAFPELRSDTELQKHVHGIRFGDPGLKQDFSRYWQESHFRRRQLDGFTIAHPFLWRRGDSVIWHRSHVHCSSDFQVSGTQFKKGLMWISRLVPAS